MKDFDLVILLNLNDQSQVRKKSEKKGNYNDVRSVTHPQFANLAPDKQEPFCVPGL